MDLKFGVVEILCVIGVDGAVSLVGLGASLAFHASNVTPPAQNALGEDLGSALLHAQQACLRFHVDDVGVDALAVKRTKTRVHDTRGLPIARRNVLIGLHKNIQIFRQFLSGNRKVGWIVLVLF